MRKETGKKSQREEIVKSAQAKTMNVQASRKKKKGRPSLNNENVSD
jgi:hypothetical protein